MLKAVLLARMKYLGRMVLLAVRLVRELLAVLLASIKPSERLVLQAVKVMSGLVLLVVLVEGGGFVAVWLAPESPWAYQWRYSSEDGMRGAVVTVDARPHNCEFMAAPLGSKNCHYKPNVATIRVRTSTAGRTVSFDEGRTWTLDEGSTQPAVWVTWERVED